MKFSNKLHLILVGIITLLCVILFIKLFRMLRSVLPWYANCWFCNTNSWIKFPERNAWTCIHCEQYNGFTKDGDYNKPLFNSSDQVIKSPLGFKRSPPKNGLCKMCNINQQLKVTQLANFIPMNKNNYDHEIESYRAQLEKAYRLCSPCKKVLQIKLHKEKEMLLGNKLLQARTPEKKYEKMDSNNTKTKLINKLSMYLTLMLLILVAIELIKIVSNNELFSKHWMNYTVMLKSIVERLYTIMKCKIDSVVPESDEIMTYFKNSLDIDYATYIPDLKYDVQKYFKDMIFNNFDKVNEVLQDVFSGIACLLQVTGHILNVNEMKVAFANDLFITIFVASNILKDHFALTPIKLCLIKLLCVAASVTIYTNISYTKKSDNTKVKSPNKNMKNLIRSSSVADEDSSSMETDDDVSLCKFGVRNLTDSSNENIGLHNNTYNSGASFTSRAQSRLCSNSKMNTMYTMNGPKVVSDSVFVKPSPFNKYQKLSKDDSDSDLDESISSLFIGSPKKPRSKADSIFSLRKFTAAPSISGSHRPLISPSKLGHGTSWVAGGYWGSESERQLFSINSSRSSSQSSGFESQTSSLNQRHLFSQPPSRDELEEDRSVMMDRFQNCNMANFGYQVPQSFSRVSSPIYPQMQYNSHVHIPQARFSSASSSVYSHPQYAPNQVFKAPGGPKILKLPQMSL